MYKIYSEKELVNNAMPWGEWKFSLSREQIDEKLSLLPKQSRPDQNESGDHWKTLFSIVREKSEPKDLKDDQEIVSTAVQTTSSENALHEIMDIEMIEEESTVDIENLSISLVDSCNQAALKFKSGLSSVENEMKNLLNDLNKLKTESLVSLMHSTWSQLHSDTSKVCFCIPFSSSSHLCKILCSDILLPWFSVSNPNKLESFSEVLSSEAEEVCVHLVAPLLKKEDSLFVKDPLNLEEFMISMTQKNWTTVFRELLKNLKELQIWQLAVLAVVVKYAEPVCEDLCVLAQLMSSSGITLAQSREFGELLVSITECVKQNTPSLITQLKIIANNYKGPLRFKALKNLAVLSE